ncbi:MAG: PQQ-binding-like beta-propeller repeat protein [Pirellula sp.]
MFGKRLRLLLWSGYSFLIVLHSAESQDLESLRNAAVKGDADMVKQCIQAKIDINTPNAYGVTPLSMACDHGREEIVRLLLEAQADPNTKDKFYRVSPLGWATMRKHKGVVGLLVKAGAKDIDSAIGMAIGARQWDLVRLFVESGTVSDKGLADSLSQIRALKKATSPPQEIDEFDKLISDRMSDVSRALYAEAENTRANAAKWASYVGTYKSETETLIVKSADGRLTVSEPDSERSTVLEASENDSFTSRGITATFDKETDKVVSLRWKAAEKESLYKRVSEETSSAGIPGSSTETNHSLAQDFTFDNEEWPNFRGTLSRGWNCGQAVASKWNGERGEGLAWKTPIPGLSTSSPIVWGDRVYVVTAIQESDRSGFRTGAYGDVESVVSDGECTYRLMSVDMNNGAIVWDREAAKEVPKVKRHAKSSHANSTPATDGKLVVACFGGAGVFCYDIDGNPVWSKNLGMLDSGWFYDRSYQWGFGSSPFIFEDTVILQCDVQEGAFIIALDLKTGDTRWRTTRDEIPTWSSPVAFMAPDGTPTVIATGTKSTAAYHARTGEKLWSLGGFSEIVVPTPQVVPDLALLTSGYAPVQPIVALLHSARGGLKIPDSKSDIAPFVWAQTRGGPYMPTPVVAKGRVYILDNSGLLTCLELNSGNRVFRQRLRSDKATAYTSSPVASHSKLYCTSEEGHTFVVSMDEHGTILEQNDLGESVLTTPAISRGRFILRGDKHLYAFQ